TPRTQKITRTRSRPRRLRRWSWAAGGLWVGVHYRDRMADGDGVVTDHDLVHDEPEDFLALPDVQRLGADAEACSEISKRLDQAQVAFQRSRPRRAIAIRLGRLVAVFAAPGSGRAVAPASSGPPDTPSPDGRCSCRVAPRRGATRLHDA